MARKSDSLASADNAAAKACWFALEKHLHILSATGKYEEISTSLHLVMMMKQKISESELQWYFTGRFEFKESKGDNCEK